MTEPVINNNEQLLKYLGLIAFNGSKLDFLLANFSVELNLVKSYADFYNNPDWKKKLEAIIKKLKDLNAESLALNSFLEYLQRVYVIRLEKEIILNSVILNRDDEYMFHNFRKADKFIQETAKHYNEEEIFRLNQELIFIHNNLHALWRELDTR